MKRIIAIMLCTLTVMALIACGQKPVAAQPQQGQTSAEATENVSKENLENMITGGWTKPESVEITDEIRTKLEKALDGMVGATYTPVAYLGSQVVAGTNHAILCRVAPVVPDPVETYAIVYLYEALDGSVEITEIADSTRATDINGMDGGWFQPETVAVPEDVKAALEKALDGMVGAAWNPVALVGQQVVAGTNYCLLCEITPVVPNAETTYTLVYLYVDLEGNAEITETVDFTAEQEETTVQIPNPFADYSTLAEAEQAAGFSLTAPEQINGYNEKIIQVMDHSMLQIIFLNGDDRLFIRKEAGSEDISGDYNEYDEIETVTVGNRAVTVKGSAGKISVAIWTDGAYTYAVAADTPMAREAMLALVSEIA